MAAAAPPPLKRARADEDGEDVDAEKRALQEKVDALEKELAKADREKQVLALTLHTHLSVGATKYTYTVWFRAWKWVDEHHEEYLPKPECTCDDCDHSDDWDDYGRHRVEIISRYAGDLANKREVVEFMQMVRTRDLPKCARAALAEKLTQEEDDWFPRDGPWLYGSREKGWDFESDCYEDDDEDESAAIEIGVYWRVRQTRLKLVTHTDWQWDRS